MVLLGVILLVLGAGAGGLAGYAAWNRPGTIELSAFGYTRAFGAVELLAVGLGAMLLVALGWAFVASAARRRSRYRREDRERARYDELAASSEAERQQFERRFEQSGRRVQDLDRREDVIEARERELDARERAIAAREASGGSGPHRTVDRAAARRAGSPSEQPDRPTEAMPSVSDEGDGSTRPMPRVEPDQR